MWVIALGACWPLHAGAQASASDTGAWRYRGTFYGYFPSLGGSASVPADPNGVAINVDADKIIDNLKFTLMGSLDAHNGRWGAFTDFIYLNLGHAKDNSRDFTIGNIGIPASTNAHIDWRLKGVVWTTAGQYRLVSDPALALDALGGVRWLNLEQDLSWNITGNIGPITPAGRTGSSSSKISNWDAVVGVKGRYALGSGSNWALPFYLDIGTGESDLTWQAAAGVTYAFSWGELVGMWR
jgi:predicted porin